MNKCGCKIENYSGFHDADPGDMTIVYCPLHASAEDLLRIVKEYRASLTGAVGRSLDPIIERAEGKE